MVGVGEGSARLWVGAYSVVATSMGTYRPGHGIWDGAARSWDRGPTVLGAYSLGAYSLGAYSLGAYSLGPPILELDDPSLYWTPTIRGDHTTPTLPSFAVRNHSMAMVRTERVQSRRPKTCWFVAANGLE